MSSSESKIGASTEQLSLSSPTYAHIFPLNCLRDTLAKVKNVMQHFIKVLSEITSFRGSVPIRLDMFQIPGSDLESVFTLLFWPWNDHEVLSVFACACACLSLGKESIHSVGEKSGNFPSLHSHNLFGIRFYSLSSSVCVYQWQWQWQWFESSQEWNRQDLDCCLEWPRKRGDMRTMWAREFYRAKHLSPRLRRRTEVTNHNFKMIW